MKIINILKMLLWRGAPNTSSTKTTKSKSSNNCLILARKQSTATKSWIKLGGENIVMSSNVSTPIPKNYVFSKYSSQVLHFLFSSGGQNQKINQNSLYPQGKRKHHQSISSHVR